MKGNITACLKSEWNRNMVPSSIIKDLSRRLLANWSYQNWIP
jgi:hypothetical protein